MSEGDDESVKLQRRANELLALLARAAIAPVLAKELEDPKDRNLYGLTGGTLPVTAISEKVGLSVGTISRTWQRWEKLGLLVKDGKRYRRILE